MPLVQNITLSNSDLTNLFSLVGNFTIHEERSFEEIFELGRITPFQVFGRSTWTMNLHLIVSPEAIPVGRLDSLFHERVWIYSSTELYRGYIREVTQDVFVDGVTSLRFNIVLDDLRFTGALQVTQDGHDIEVVRRHLANPAIGLYVPPNRPIAYHRPILPWHLPAPFKADWKKVGF